MTQPEPQDSAGAEDIRSDAKIGRENVGKGFGDEDDRAEIGDMAEHSGKFVDGGVRGRRRRDHHDHQDHADSLRVAIG
jgi:hypothetical protein